MNIFNIPKSLLEAINKVQIKEHEVTTDNQKYVGETATTETKQRIYYRGTDNPKEDSLIKSKEIRPSLNHVTQEREKGLSVSDVPSVGKYFKHLYKLTGKEIGLGADGEPLLDVDTVEFIDWVHSPKNHDTSNR